MGMLLSFSCFERCVYLFFFLPDDGPPLTEEVLPGPDLLEEVLPGPDLLETVLPAPSFEADSPLPVLFFDVAFLLDDVLPAPDLVAGPVLLDEVLPGPDLLEMVPPAPPLEADSPLLVDFFDAPFLLDVVLPPPDLLAVFFDVLAIRNAPFVAEIFRSSLMPILRTAARRSLPSISLKARSCKIGGTNKATGSLKCALFFLTSRGLFLPPTIYSSRETSFVLTVTLALRMASSSIETSTERRERMAAAFLIK